MLTKYLIFISIVSLVLGLPEPNTGQFPLQLPGQEACPPGHRPPHRTPIPNPTEKTIYEYLNADPKFSRLAKAINFSENAVALLNKPSASLTFFAVPNWAIPQKPRHGIPPREVSESYGLPEVVSLIEDINYSAYQVPNKKKHKKFLKMILEALLAYHTLPQGLTIASLAENTTHATNLTYAWTFGGQPQRIRFQHVVLPPLSLINLYSKVVQSNLEVKNGFIHVVNHPLLPPLPLFQEAYLSPSIFSFYTTALQRSGLTDTVDLRYVPREKGKGGSLVGTRTATAFVPLNRAFERLPKKLQLFLFSPFGGTILKKLLQYHIIPDLVLHSDHVYNASSQVATHSPLMDIPPSITSPTGIDPVYAVFSKAQNYEAPELFALRARSPAGDVEITPALNITVPTLLANSTVQIEVIKRNISIPIPGPHTVIEMRVNGIPVAIPDVVALNGALHITNFLLSPRRRLKPVPRPKDPEEEWQDWEEWLPQWAIEN